MESHLLGTLSTVGRIYQHCIHQCICNHWSIAQCVICLTCVCFHIAGVNQQLAFRCCGFGLYFPNCAWSQCTQTGHLPASWCCTYVYEVYNVCFLPVFLIDSSGIDCANQPTVSICLLVVGWQWFPYFHGQLWCLLLITLDTWRRWNCNRHSTVCHGCCWSESTHSITWTNLQTLSYAFNEMKQIWS